MTRKQRQNFINKVCAPFKSRLSCSIHGENTSWEHFHLELLTEGGKTPPKRLEMKPLHTTAMPCPWPHALTNDDICPVLAVLPQ